MVPVPKSRESNRGMDSPAATINKSRWLVVPGRVPSRTTISVGAKLEAWSLSGGSMSCKAAWEIVNKLAARWRKLVVKIQVRQRNLTSGRRIDIWLGPGANDGVVVRLMASVLKQHTGWRIRETVFRGGKNRGQKLIVESKVEEPCAGESEPGVEPTSHNEATTHTPWDMNIWSWNINGSRKKLAIIDIELSKCLPDIISLQETRRTGTGWPLRVLDYSLIHSHAVRNIPGARGITLGVRGMSVCEYGKSTPNWILGKCFGGHLKKQLVAGSIYLPTKSRQKGLRPRMFRELASMLKSTCKRLTPTHVPFILSGDFNMSGKELDKWIAKKGINMRRIAVRGNAGTFRRKGRTNTDVDHIIVNKEWLLNCKPAYVRRTVIGSDHYPISVSIIALDKETTTSAPRDEKYSYLCLDSVKGKYGKKGPELTELTHHPKWCCLEVMDHPAGSEGRGKELPEQKEIQDGMFDNDETGVRERGEVLTKTLSTGEMDSKFIESAHDIATEMGLRKSKPVLPGRFKLNLSGRCRRLIAKRSALEGELYGKDNQNVPQEDLNEMEAELLTVQAAAATMVRKERTEAWCRSVRQILQTTGGGGARAYWAWIRRTTALTASKTKGGVDPIQHPITGEVLTDVDDVKEAWRLHYTALAADSDGKSKNFPYWAALCSSMPRAVLLEEPNSDFTWTEICETMEGFMKTNKAPGSDKLTLEFLRLSIVRDKVTGEIEGVPTNPMGQRIFELLQIVWRGGEIPKDWLVSTVVSIPKSGDLTDMNNYRGVSLMPILSKVLYTVVNRRLGKALEGSGFWIKEQAGFRPGEEAVAQAVALFEILKRRSIKNKPTFCAFIDMKKAFDTVPHGALLAKLESAGVGGRALDLIRKLYSQSTFAVRGGFGLTEEIQLLRGVRQGCPLSSLLFNVFINDILSENVRNGLGVETPGLEGFISGLLFADDLCLLADSEAELQVLLDSASTWAKKWGMTFGIKKCAVVATLTDVESLRLDNVWWLGGEVVPIADQYTYLGVEIGGSLDMKLAADANLKKGRNLLHKLKFFLRCWNVPVTSRIMVLKACIYPVLLYGSELWGMNVALTRKHETLVNKALRWIYGTSGSGVSVECMRLEFNVPSIVSLAAERRAGALLTWGQKRTWIKDLVMNEEKCLMDKSRFKDRKKSWTTGGTLWLTKNASTTPVKSSNKPIASESTPDLSQKEQEVKMGRGNWGAPARRGVEKRSNKNHNAVHYKWYAQYFLQGGKGDHRRWHKAFQSYPEVQHDLSFLARARIGAIPTATDLATWGKIGISYKTACPFCSDNDRESSDTDGSAHADLVNPGPTIPIDGVPEDLAHLVLECPRWKKLRDLYMITDMTQQARTLIDIEGRDEILVKKEILALLLGGFVANPESQGESKPKVVQLYRWHPPSYQEYREEVVQERRDAAAPGDVVPPEPEESAIVEEMAQVLLLADPQLERSTAVKMATLERQKAVDADYKERLSNCGAVRIARFLFKICRLRQKTLRSLGVDGVDEFASDIALSGHEAESSDDVPGSPSSPVGARRSLFGTGG